MAGTTSRRTRKTQPQTEGQEQPQTEDGRTDVDTSTGEVIAAELKPSITVDAVPVTYYRPTVTMPDGTVIVCEHKYLHEHQKAAEACGRKMAAAGRFVK